MSLDDKLGPISRALGPIGRAYYHIDDEVRRQYTKVTKGEDGLQHAVIAWGASFVVGVGGVGPLIYYSGNAFIPMCYLASAYIGTTSWPIIAKAFTGSHDGTKSVDNKKIIEDHQMYSIWRLLRGIRLATLAAGSGAAIIGGATLVQGLQEQNLKDVYLGADLLSSGVSFAAGASAAYFVDTDPALLDKAPLWKRALNGIRNTFSPKIPVPVEAQ